ncbi:MAG: tetratricopeptide repeat protein [Kiritimatiellae bacterium]|nr:tetratricopeptide repeat protein [Kiritimatiellia bacterium]
MNDRVWQRRWPVLLVLCAAALCAYAPVFYAGFVTFDDPRYITENVYVRNGLTGQSIRWAWTTCHAGIYHPLAWLSHMLDTTLVGLAPRWHHVHNLLLHAANACLLFLGLRRLTGKHWRSAVVALLFVVHPLTVESVAWVTERKNVLSTFFWLLAAGAYIRYTRTQRLPAYLLCWLLFVLGLLAKPFVITFPFALLLLDYWPLKRFSLAAGPAAGRAEKWRAFARAAGPLVLEKVPWFLFSAVFAWLAAGAAWMSLNRTLQTGQEFVPVWERLANVLVGYAAYARTVVLPIRLVFFYPYPNEGWPPVTIVVSSLALGAVSLAAARRGRQIPAVAVGWLWYLGVLFPNSGIVHFGGQCRADRYVYVPMIGLLVMLVWWVAETIPAGRGKRRRAVTAAVTGAVTVLLGIGTWVQSSAWDDSESLYRDGLRQSKGNYLALLDLGNLRYRTGNYRQAEQYYLEVLNLKPQLAEVYSNLGAIAFVRGDRDRALRMYDKAIKLNPWTGQAYLNKGLLYHQRGDERRAIGYYKLALIWLGPDPTALNNLGAILLHRRALDEAERCFRAALAADPELESARINLNKVQRGRELLGR